MDSLKHIKSLPVAIVIILASNLSAQSIDDFIGNWSGTETLNSTDESYEDNYISIQIEAGGDREGFHVYTSTSDFIYNQNLNWAYHYFGIDKDENQLIFYRRFVTPIGHLGFDEKRYDILSWDGESIVAEHNSQSGQTSHLIRVNLQSLGFDHIVTQYFSLNQNYPNPFNPSTTINLQTEIEVVGSLKIFDITGREIKILKEGTFSAGDHSYQWNGTNHFNQSVSAGTYIYRFMANDFVQSHKMVLLK